MPTQSATESSQPWTIKRLLQWTSTYLSNADIEHGRLCAEILLADVLKKDRIELYTHFDYCPNPQELATYRALIKRCAAHEPVQYLTGKAHFMGLTLKVTPAVLIPRPETELLVEQALTVINEWLDVEECRVLDLCTGSGCIALAIANSAIEARVVATDISDEALDIARQNAQTLELGNRIQWLKSDLFNDFTPPSSRLFHIIVSNPPYISTEEFSRLDRNVKEYEPQLALQGGTDGLNYYRRIIQDAGVFLAGGGWLMLEVGYNQADAITNLMEHAGYLTDIRAVKDHLGHHRIVKAQKIVTNT